MNPLFIGIVIIAYFALLIGLAKLVSRRADNATFFTGNRRMPWPLVAVAMICAPISGVTFISVPGMVMTKGYGYLQMCLGFIVGYLVIAFVLLPVFYRNRVVSIYGFLGDRFGVSAHKTGAWLFLISKILGTAVRFLVICLMLQVLVFDALGVAFPVTVVVTMVLVWLYTVSGGVKAVIWTDMLKCACLILSVGVCLYLVSDSLGLSPYDYGSIIQSHPSAYIFNFDDPAAESYFWKQFLAGVFLVVAMTGLDQDMMQHALSCRDARSSMKNMALSSVMQFVVISLFLFLGTLLMIYAERNNIVMPEKSDNLFATVVFHEGLPVAAGLFFVLGLVAATYSSAGSALTSLTTSYTIDICRADKKYTNNQLSRRRLFTHAAIAAIMTAVIIAFYYLSSQDAISAVFTLASYTYGPILGLFAFGLMCKRDVRAKWLPFVCIACPLLCLALEKGSAELWNYHIGFELLLINAGLTIVFLAVISRRRSVILNKS